MGKDGWGKGPHWAREEGSWATQDDKKGKKGNGHGAALRIQPKRMLGIEAPFYFFLISFQNQIEFKFKWFLNKFRTKAHNQFKIKYRWHENSTNNYINPKLI
jgi:hypothetical protein